MAFRKGFDALPVPDTGCNVPLVSKEFVRKHRLYVHALSAEQKKRYKVKMGDNIDVEPMGRTIMWIAAKETANDQRLRRRIFALVMPSLPTPMLLSLNTLKRLGLLPKDWPLCKQINLSEEDQRALDEIELSPLSEPEEELNTCLHAEHGASHPDHDFDSGIDDRMTRSPREKRTHSRGMSFLHPCLTRPPWT